MLAEGFLGIDDEHLVLQRNVISKTLFLGLKSEARNPKSETISNVQNPNFQNKNARLAPVVVLDFGNLNFVFVSNFDIRISNLTVLR